MLLTRNIEITFLVRENRFWGNVLPEQEGKLIADHMKKHHVDLLESYFLLITFFVLFPEYKLKS